jgi:stage V sporulation protein B
MSSLESDKTVGQEEALASPDEAAQAQKEADAQETARTTGRGFLVITAAKLWFMVTGALIQLGLPIVFGSAELFGVFKIVTEAIGLLNMVVITGSLQAVAKLVSERPDRAREIVNQALKLQLMLGVPLTLVYALASPWIAGAFFNDPTLAPLMQVSSLIILFYAYYAIFVGYLNGIKSFVRQASLDIGFQTMKTIGMLGLVAAGFGVAGAVWGFAGAAGMICLISGVWTMRILRAGQPEKAPEKEEGGEEIDRDQLKRLGTFLLLVMAYTFALNGLLRADLFVLKSIASRAPEAWSALAPVFGTVSDKFAGFYGAALNLSRLPYQGVIAVTFVIFPLISEATFQQDRDRTRVYIEDTFRYCLILIAGVALPLIFNADSLIGALYSTDYQAAADALAIMSTSIIFFALFYVAATIITGAGRPGVAGILMGISLLISAGLNWAFIQDVHATVMGQLSWTPGAAAKTSGASETVHMAASLASERASFAAAYVKFAPDYMRAAAMATAISMFTGFTLALGWLWRVFGAVPPFLTIGRLLLASGLLYGVDQIGPDPVAYVKSLAMGGITGKLVMLGAVGAKMAIMGLVLLAVLVLTREFVASDFARLRAVIGRKKKKKEPEESEDAQG